MASKTGNASVLLELVTHRKSMGIHSKYTHKLVNNEKL